MRLIVAIIAMLSVIPAALAQGTGQGAATGQVQNPLRPAARAPAAAQPPAAQAPAASAPAAERPRRERSDAQKKNDEDMRACGADWRANKASLQAQGKTWITFSKDCRATRRSQRSA